VAGRQKNKTEKEEKEEGKEEKEKDFFFYFRSIFLASVTAPTLCEILVGPLPAKHCA
jgi:hypothetical protein